MKVHLFSQCIVDMFYPQVGIAAVEVLERLGCEIVLPKKQVCCGQPLINSGYVQASKASIKNTIEAFEDAEIIVSLSGSCAFAMKHEYQNVLHLSLLISDIKTFWQTSHNGWHVHKEWLTSSTNLLILLLMFSV